MGANPTSDAVESSRPFTYVMGYETAPGEGSAALEAAVRPIRVFLVDDQAEVRRGLRMRLEVEDDIVVIGEAGDGRVLAQVRALEPDLILMDVSMPQMDGMEALAVLCESIPCVAVVMLSLYDDAETRERAMALGARDFIGKHQVEGDLIDAIRRAAGEGRNNA